MPGNVRARRKNRGEQLLKKSIEEEHNTGEKRTRGTDKLGDK